MKKYIKTRSGKIELNDPAIEREIIAEADTIEELLDGVYLLDRLTIKVPNDEHYRTYETKFIQHKAIDKLGQLEDIEDELKVPFLTLKIACEEGFYSAYFKKIVHPLRLVIFGKYIRPYFEVYDKELDKIKPIFVDDYGITWVLTQEQLK